MKILISEAQYEKLVMELQHHPDNHDIDQRKLRMGRLESGVNVVMEWTPREMRLVNKINVPVTTGKPQTEIIGKYLMKSDVTQLINQRLDEIYSYIFPKFKSYAVLIYDFILTSKNVINDKIIYIGEPEDDTVKNKVKEVMKKKDLMSASLSLTGYEEKDKSKIGSELSNDYRAEYMVMIIDRNVAKTVFLTSKRQWEEKTFYGDFGWSIDEYIRYDQVPNHATKVDTRKEPAKEPQKDIRFSPVAISKEVKENWIMEWVNSTKK